MRQYPVTAAAGLYRRSLRSRHSRLRPGCALGIGDRPLARSVPLRLAGDRLRPADAGAVKTGKMGKRRNPPADEGLALPSKVGDKVDTAGGSPPFCMSGPKTDRHQCRVPWISRPATPTASSNGFGLTEDRLRLARLPATSVVSFFPPPAALHREAKKPSPAALHCVSALRVRGRASPVARPPSRPR